MGWLDLTDECSTAVNRWDGGYGAPARENRGQKGITVFRNAFVERWFATSHPALPGLWFGGFIVWGLVVGFVDPSVGVVAGLGLYALGVLAWTLLEYVLHRTVFHFAPRAHFQSKLRQFMMHGYHHQFPNDPWRLVAPPLMSWPIAMVVWMLYRLALGPDLVWAAFGGTCGGYLAYDWTHYYTHHFTPTTALGRFLRRTHMIHHFANPDANHGISSPLWDFVFRTFQARGQAAESRGD
jgi:hypothetical protein